MVRCRAGHERASPWGALLLCLLLAAPAAAGAASGCRADRVDARVQVSHVYDGDTVRLADGRHVRFIGINAPEVAHRDEPGEPYGRAARTAVQALFARDAHLQLRFDAERHDHYGRLLAHLYLPDGQSVEERLLRQGLATLLVMPPNLANLDCYRAAERAARQARRGLWGDPYFQPRQAARVPRSARGYHLVRGTVRAVHETRRSIWLQLDGLVSVRIAKQDLGYFDAVLAVRQLAGRHILVRGWLHPTHRGLMIRARHPAALELLETTESS